MYGLDLIHETHENHENFQLYVTHLLSPSHLHACTHPHTPTYSHACTLTHTLTFSQTERDVSVRQRAIDLLYAMCDHTNAQTIVEELLHYLEKADYSIRETLV